jgi:16S rRNA (uracil1498-N3)-methyltransferase
VGPKTLDPLGREDLNMQADAVLRILASNYKQSFIFQSSMNLILLFKDDFVEGEDSVRLTGRRLNYVLNIHRASVGDELCVGLAGDRVGMGRITFLDESALEMEVRLERMPPLALPVTLILALPRPKVLRRVLRAVSALGVKRIILLNCFRVEKSFWQSPFLCPEAIQEQLVLGLEQAKDTTLPDVLLRPLFKPFVEDELPGLMEGTLPLVAHPAAAQACPRNVNQPVTLIIGPEGGFIPYEIEKLIDRRFTAVQMGERILSVETAVPALLSRLY